MKLDRILKGRRAVTTVPLPLTKPPAQTAVDLTGFAGQQAEDQKAAQPGPAPSAVPEPLVGLRVLTGDDTETVCEKAWARAQQKGATAPTEDDPLYAIAVKVYTCAVACVDPDDPDALFFGDTVEEAAETLRSCEILGRDVIIYLAERQEVWQDLCSPQIARLDPMAFMRKIGEIAAAEDFEPFLELQPAMRAILARSMARTLWPLLQDRFGPGSSFLDDEPSSSESADAEAAEPAS